MRDKYRLKTFVINLPDETKRREEIQKHLNEIGIEHSIFAGKTPETLREEERRIFLDETGHPHNKEMTLGEVGCYASHFSLIRQLSEEERKTAYFILEDDVILNKDTRSILEEMMEYIDDLKIDMVNLRHRKRACPLHRQNLARHPGYCLAYPWIPSLSSAAYVMTSEGARKYIQYIKYFKRNRIDFPFDSDFRNAFFEGFIEIWELEGYTVRFLPCPSSIDKRSSGRKRKRLMKKRQLIRKAIQRHGLASARKIFPFLFYAYGNKVRYKLTGKRA